MPPRKLLGDFHAQKMLLVTSETQTVYVPEVTKSSKLVMENLTECTKCNCQLLCIKRLSSRGAKIQPSPVISHYKTSSNASNINLICSFFVNVKNHSMI